MEVPSPLGLWCIKGYHFFKIRPDEEIPLLVLPEYGNKYDRNAVKVMMPDCVNEDMLEWVSQEMEKVNVKHRR